MRLIDCFLEALALTSETLQQIENGEHGDYSEIRLSIEQAISENAADYIAGEYSKEQYEMAKYAVIAYIDEAFLSSDWQHKAEWKKELLQVKHFQSLTAGESFFEKLNSLSPLNPAERDIREVFHYCLALGFKGKFFQSSDQVKLEEIKNANLNLLTDGKSLLNSLDKAPLFPFAYQPGKKGKGILKQRDWTPFYYGLPIVFIAVLFFIFKTHLMDMANYLVSTI